MSGVALLGTAGALALTAIVGWSWLRGRLPAGLSALERALATLLLGTTLVACGALLLGDLGWFGPVPLVALLVVFGTAGLLATRRGGKRAALPPRPGRRDLWLLVAGAVLLAVALPPFEWVLGGRDPGTYVNGALQLRASGSIAAERPFLREVPPDVLKGMSLWEPDPIPGRPRPAPPADPYERDLWPGMYLGRPDRVVPQGFHLFPALLAAGGEATGDEGLWTVPALALLVVLSCALLAGRLAEGLRDSAAEVASAVALVAGLGFVWWARYPTAELLDAALLAGGVWLWVLASRANSAWTAGAAGVVVGASLLTRADAVLLIPALVLVGVGLAVMGRFGATARAFFLSAAAMAVAAGLHAGLFARDYLEDVSVHSPAGWATLGAAGAAALLAAALALSLRGPVRAWLEASARQVASLAPAAVLALFLVVGVVAHARGWIPWHWLRWFLGESGLAIGAAGAAVLVGRLLRGQTPAVVWLLVVLAAATLVLYLPNARISPDLPWGFRRFLPVLVPVWAIGVGIAAAAALSYGGHWRVAVRAGAAILGLVALLQLAAGLVPTLGHREYAGAGDAVERLDSALGPGRPLVLFGAHAVALHRFGPAIGVGRGRDALPVTALRAGPAARWVAARAARKPVLLVTYGTRLPPLDRRSLTVRRQTAVRFDIPEEEQPLNRLPTRARRLAGQLILWRVHPTR